MFKEFKEFALKGNLVDMAVAFVMGAAFGKVTTSFIQGLVMPIVSLLTGGNDFTAWKIVLKAAVKEGDKVVKPEIALLFGDFVTATIDFLVVAFVMFLIVRAMNAMKKAEAAASAAPAAPPAQEILLAEIRDLLRKK
jgi:large conductance mechanosensitive channel